ncbi:hypothetical protein [Roseibium sp.]|uniref:hypothetical protein n=1 Tax=Roseibium sp. TaxID=1936156 RepID=UPI003D0CCD67
MLPLWPLFVPPALQPVMTRQARLQDLDARMASYLADKQATGTASPTVLDNVRSAKTAVQREMATRS